MPGKTPYIVVHNYGMGSIGYRIFASDIKAVEKIFPPIGYEIKAQADMPKDVDWQNVELLESDIDRKEFWFARLVESFEQKRKGKSAFWVRGSFRGETAYRQVYARHWDEISERYPGLETLQGKVISGEILKELQSSDIDCPDDFLLSFEVPQ